MLTHYIPYFTRENGLKRGTACGGWVLERDHSNEPTCPICKAYLEQQLADQDLSVEDVFGPAPDPVDPRRI